MITLQLSIGGETDFVVRAALGGYNSETLGLEFYNFPIRIRDKGTFQGESTLLIWIDPAKNQARESKKKTMTVYNYNWSINNVKIGSVATDRITSGKSYSFVGEHDGFE